jgi:hypothetical protein
MKQFGFAALAAAALGAPALAQPVPVQPIPVQPVPVQPLPVQAGTGLGFGIGPPPVQLYQVVPPTAVPVPNPPPVPPAPTYVGPPGPAIPFQKSGGTLVGLYGYYPYDTGNYLLGDGVVSRQAGFFTMVYPGGNFPPPAASASDALPAYAPSHFKHKFFHR